MSFFLWVERCRTWTAREQRSAQYIVHFKHVNTQSMARLRGRKLGSESALTRWYAKRKAAAGGPGHGKVVHAGCVLACTSACTTARDAGWTPGMLQIHPHGVTQLLYNCRSKLSPHQSIAGW